jgi:hypothetical protein
MSEEEIGDLKYRIKEVSSGFSSLSLGVRMVYRADQNVI